MAPSPIAAITGASPYADAAPSLAEELKSGKSHMLRTLIRAFNRIAEAEQTITQKNAEILRLESLALTDSLTGLMNRRGFVDQLCRITAAAERYDEAGVLGYIDLDNFKPVNDDLGHECGDELLRLVAQTIIQNVRQRDMVARIGGDEFAILFVQTTAAQGTRLARKLQSALNETHLSQGRIRIPISASLGIAPYVSGTDPKALMRRADPAMYLDKGRRQKISREPAYSKLN